MSTPSRQPGLPAPPQPKYFGIQVLRAFAATLVVLHHQAEAADGAFQHLPNLTWLLRGSFGVDVFFPISGFVLYLTAAAILRRTPLPGDWQSFAYRRFVRVAPLYWLFTLLKLAVFVAVPSLLLHYRFRLWNTLAAFVFLPALNYMGQPEPPLVVGWTLSYEMLFYTIVTAAIALRQPLLRWCAAVIAGLALLSLFLPHALGGLTYLADPIELEFLAGMLLAAAAPRLRAIPASVAILLFAAALAWALGHPTPSLDFHPIRALYWGIPGALIVLAVVSLEDKYRLGRSRLLLLLGDASYSLYLTHTFLVPAIRVLFVRLHWQSPAALLAFFLAGLLLSLTVAILTHLYLELPLLRLLTHRQLPWSTRAADSRNGTRLP